VVVLLMLGAGGYQQCVIEILRSKFYIFLAKLMLNLS
jgi:hypothetical protein